MNEGNSGWPASPANPAKPDSGLAPLAPLAQANEPIVRDAHGRFLTGNNGGGRKKGGRNRLTETFITTIESDFAEYGPEVLAKLRVDDPSAYIRIIASLIPRDLILKREQERDFSELSFPELIDLIDNIRENANIEQEIAKARLGL